MKKKEIIKKLIILYRAGITNCKKVNCIQTIIDILISYKIRNGVCYTALYSFGADIYNKKWVKRNKKDKTDYWWPIPSDQKTKRDIIKSLEVRLKILEKELDRAKS